MDLDLTKWDSGFDGLVREVMIVLGTDEVKYEVLLENGYKLHGIRDTLMMKKYEHYSVCYKKVDDYFNLQAIARIEQGG